MPYKITKNIVFTSHQITQSNNQIYFLNHQKFIWFLVDILLTNKIKYKQF